MTSHSHSLRALALLLATAAMVLSACSKKSDDTPATPDAGNGTIVWTYNGQTYTSTTYSGAIVEPGDCIIVTGSPDLNTAVSLKIEGINAKGVGTYPLAKSTTLAPVPSAGLSLDAKNPATGRLYTTDFSSGTSNGSIVVTQYDKVNQKLAGTFSFTAGPYAGQGTGTVTVTNGSFNITKFN